MTTEALRAIVDSTERDLGMTAERAEELREEIAADDLQDDLALQAYDLLHTRACFGRAW